MNTTQVTKISVRNLVEFMLRSGDLTSGGFSSSSRALEGGRIHRQIQKEQGTHYQAEVYLVHQAAHNGVILEVSGRADGVLIQPDKVIIDEIKSTTKLLELITEQDYPLYWAQAQCYAFMYAAEHNLPEITVQLTYCQFVSRDVKRFQHTYSHQELQTFFSDLIDRYCDWAERLQNWKTLRDASAKDLLFPFSAYRAGQRELAVAIYRTISTGKKLFAQAPTGTGKTMAAVFPAVKAMGKGLVEKIFFLTAKTVTRDLAEDAFMKLRQQGLRCKTITLTAKEKICFKPGSACTAQECEYAHGYYDRLPDALADVWVQESFTRKAIEEHARKYGICPFEFSLDVSLWADCIICDYNYVFDPRVYLKRFFNEAGENYCFLVDEAHNLVERAREMFSAELVKQPFLELKRVLKSALPAVAKAAGAVNTGFTALGTHCAEENPSLINKEPPQDIFPLLRKFVSLAEDWLSRNEPAAWKEDLLEIYFAAYAFLRTADSYDDRYVTYVEKSGRDLKVKLFCVDPSLLLRAALTRGRATIFFSATLSPSLYFSNILGGEAEDGRIAVASPFSAAHLRLLVADKISTTYKRRAQTYNDVVNYITAVIQEKQGNYLVFLPSYPYLEEVCSRFSACQPNIQTLCQQSGMTEEERAEFLRRFSVDNTKTLVGFAVLGGVFGEGIDLVGERLVGAIIVGVGLPQLCLERDIIRSFFNEDNGQGFEYAYMYPGMIKVLQAAGRVIRSEQDRGIVLLIDERFGHNRYRRLFPAEWRDPAPVQSRDELARAVRLFWQKKEQLGD